MHLRAAALVAAAALLAAPAAADTLRVPSEAYPQLQDAVDASADGDTILVGPGTLPEGAVLEGRHDLRIRGVDGAVLDSEGITLVSCDRITISGIAFEDATDTSTAVSAVDCAFLVLKDLRIEGYDGDAILLEGCDRARVTGCTVADGGAAGLRDRTSVDLAIDRCTFAGNGGGGIVLSEEEETGSDRARVTRNTISGPGHGISGRGNDLRVEGNALVPEEGTGILLGEDGDFTGGLVRRNTVTTGALGHRGISVRGDGARVSRNDVEGSVGIGVYTRGSGNRVDGNRVTGCFQGVHTSGSDTVVAGNVATATTSIGIFVTQGGDSLVTGNRVLDAGDTGFAVNQPGAVVTRNFCEGAATAFSSDFPPATYVGNAAGGSSFADFVTTYSEGQYTMARNRFETVIFDYEPPPLEL
jgi:hypothetical protein